MHHVAKTSLAISTLPDNPAPTEPLLMELREYVEKIQKIPGSLDPEMVGLFLIRRIRVLIAGLLDALEGWTTALPSFISPSPSPTGMTLPQLVGQVTSAGETFASLPSSPKQAAIDRVNSMMELVEDARNELNQILEEAEAKNDGEEEEEEDDFFDGDNPALPRTLHTALIQLLPVIRLSGLILKKATTKTLPSIKAHEGDGAWLNEWVNMAEGVSQCIDEVAGVFWGEMGEEEEEGQGEIEGDQGIRELKVRVDRLLHQLEQPILLLTQREEPSVSDHRAWYDRCWKEARRMVDQGLEMEIPVSSKPGVKRAA